MKPTVAIVGRPNVGKSTFFNKTAGRRISIVQDVPGVTRDRIVADAEWRGRHITGIDTGGIEFNTADNMISHIFRQAKLAMDAADVIVFFVDHRAGLTSDDYAFAEVLRKCGKPVILAVNKMDVFKPDALYGYYELGLGEPFGVSSEQGMGLGDLLDEIIRSFPKNEPEEETDALKIAVVGKPNAGKSSIVNKILNEERVIVSDIAGTTRDAVDTPVMLDGQKYIIIDTAGLRRKRGVEERSVEAVSAIMAMKAIERADVVLVLFDAAESLSEQDVRIAGYVDDLGKPSVIVVNKWDAVEKDTYTAKRYEDALGEALKFMSYALPVFVSAKTGQRVDKAVGLARVAYANSSRRISTGVLNELISDAVAVTEPPSFSGRRLKIYYSVQAEANPPTFIMFVNDGRLMHFSYKRYLENALRRSVDFTGTPIRLIIRNKESNQ
ncbi:MAG: ribosome biogenesis GTPase Der [Clostridiales bacterium]|jgi:GTP-binding protein|nr:ribosome biogenesis GTPase Der [Clostridiales bacterium]